MHFGSAGTGRVGPNWGGTPVGAVESTRLSPLEAFDVLSDETRFGIIQALWELYDPEEPVATRNAPAPSEQETGVSFSELYERVGYDDTGNFSYHLGKLVDHFVRQSPTGYELTAAGVEVARSVLTGTVHERPTLEAEAVDATCHLCDGAVVVGYEEHHVIAACRRCRGIWPHTDGEGGVLFRLPVPPAGLSGRTRAELFYATLEYTVHRIRSSLDGVCPDCSSVVEPSLGTCEAHDPGGQGGCPQCHRQHALEAVVGCPRCNAVSCVPLTVAILAFPVVTAFYYDHGIEQRFASWHPFRRGQTVEETVIDTAPLRVRVTVPCADAELRLTLDASLSLVDVSRNAVSN